MFAGDPPCRVRRWKDFPPQPAHCFLVVQGWFSMPLDRGGHSRDPTSYVPRPLIPRWGPFLYFVSAASPTHMTKSALATSLDALQGHLNPWFRQAGFRKHGRTYNRTTTDGLTHVIGFQMGSFDPPGTTHIPGLRENLYGRFTVNLGVYVPEVARNHGGGEAKSIVHDYNCCIRIRLGRSAVILSFSLSHAR
jgi:uncharacterized protein DUF4304